MIEEPGGQGKVGECTRAKQQIMKTCHFTPQTPRTYLERLGGFFERGADAIWVNQQRDFQVRLAEVGDGGRRLEARVGQLQDPYRGEDGVVGQGEDGLGERGALGPPRGRLRRRIPAAAAVVDVAALPRPLLRQRVDQRPQHLVGRADRADPRPRRGLAELGRLERRRHAAVRRDELERCDGVVRLAAPPQRPLVARGGDPGPFQVGLEVRDGEALVAGGRRRELGRDLVHGGKISVIRNSAHSDFGARVLSAF